MLALEIMPHYREQVLKNLEMAGYSEGPKQETLYSGADMWVFGKEIMKQEVYIKITMGIRNSL